MWQEFQNTYKGKKVFITGHTGFKGAWLTQTLHMLGADITGYSLAPYYDNNLYEILSLDGKCHSIIADIRDAQKLKSEIKICNPDFIFHLAAQPLVRASYDDPHDTYSSNVMGTLNVLDGIRHLEKAVSSVLITTDKVYENNESGTAFKESDKLGGYDPYSSSKACCEILIDSFVRSFYHIDKYDEHQKAIGSCRAGNVIGGGDWATDRLVPDIIRALKKNESIEIRSPQAVRPWQHVIEPIFGYLLLGQQLTRNPQKFAGAYNFGPTKEDILSVLEVVEKAIDIWGSGSYDAKINPNAPHEAEILKLDCSKAREVLEWRPVWNVNQCLQNTMEWYRTNFENPSGSEEKLNEQIRSYIDQWEAAKIA